MPIVWNKKTINWFHTASTYTGFHRRLAEMLLPQLKTGGSFCDLGCGIGQLDLELAPHAERITCVDINPIALDVLRQEAAQKGITNLEVLQADAGSIEGLWDNVLMTFYGRAENMLDHALKLCRNNLIFVTHAADEGSFSPKNARHPKCETVDRTIAILQQRGLNYQLINETLEYGQPLSSREEALDFIATYSKNTAPEALQAHLDEHLRENDHPDWPYYFPSQKRFGIIIISRSDSVATSR